jgi:hypothetical protein
MSESEQRELAKAQTQSMSILPSNSNLDREAANPPPSTRPPPLDLPARDPKLSTIQHLFRTGKAYLKFYKTGLYQIVTNVRLTWALRDVDELVNLQPSSTSTTSQDNKNTNKPSPPRPGTRAAALLQRRTQHDLRKLPLFGLVLLICGEFTPLVVLIIPSIVPLTCRIPAQVRKLQREAEARRKASFSEYAYRLSSQSAGSEDTMSPAGARHICRSLGLVGGVWDRIGLDIPSFLAQSRAAKGVRTLVGDDVLLVRAGGVPALEADEVRLACVDRGIDVLERDEQTLKDLLSRWLELTTAPLSDEAGSVGVSSDVLHNIESRIRWLLYRGPEEWSVAQL